MLWLNYNFKHFLIKSDNTENTSKENSHKQPTKVKLPDFRIEYTRSEGEACTKCKKMIRAPEIRLKNVQYTADLMVENGTHRGSATWYHIPCFVRSRRKLGWLESGEHLPGFKRLLKKDKEIVQEQVP